MSCTHLPWLSTGSTLRQITFAPRSANCFSRPATAPSSVVQTGVKSLGWENRTAQLSPIQSWKLITPLVVSAMKSGATSLMRSDMFDQPFWSYRLIYRTTYLDVYSRSDVSQQPVTLVPEISCFATL